MWIGVISDTHGLLRPEAVDALRGAELIVHAGDVVISAGSEPQSVAPTLSIFFVRDPNNIVVELLHTHAAP